MATTAASLTTRAQRTSFESDAIVSEQFLQACNCKVPQEVETVTRMMGVEPSCLASVKLSTRLHKNDKRERERESLVTDTHHADKDTAHWFSRYYLNIFKMVLQESSEKVQSN